MAAHRLSTFYPNHNSEFICLRSQRLHAWASLRKLVRVSLSARQRGRVHSVAMPMRPQPHPIICPAFASSTASDHVSYQPTWTLQTSYYTAFVKTSDLLLCSLCWCLARRDHSSIWHLLLASSSQQDGVSTTATRLEARQKTRV